MKRNRITWAMPLAALCLLATACSKESNEPVEPQTRILTIGCDIGKTTATPGTRAGVIPGNPDQSKENFIWHTNGEFKGWLIPEGESNYKPKYWLFKIDSEYSDDKPSNSAAFTCSDFPTGSYKMFATYPGSNFEFDNNNGFTYGLLTQTQIGKSSTKHLDDCMSMYATTTVASSTSTMTFHHLNSLVRFTVTNKNATACRIKRIEMVNSDGQTSIFGVEYSLTYDWEKKSITNSCIRNVMVAGMYTQDAFDTTKGIELSAANAADNSDTFDAYMMVGASNVPLTGQQIVFQIVATDADGGNWRSYTSLALDAGKIIAANGGAITWEPGKRYWFDLVLDDALTVSLKEVTNLPGWNDETDL